MALGLDCRVGDGLGISGMWGLAQVDWVLDDDGVALGLLRVSI